MIKIDTMAWSDAELDIIAIRAIAGLLSHELHQEGHKQYSDVAYAIERLAESSLSSVESGMIRGA